MIKTLIVFVLLFGIATAAQSDLLITSTHNILENLTDQIALTEYYYGNHAMAMNKNFNINNTYEFLQNKYQDISILEWKSNTSNETVEVTLYGEYNNYITNLGNGEYKLGGRGFIDTICAKKEILFLPPINQEFIVTTLIPGNYGITKYAENISRQKDTMEFNLTTELQNNTIVQRLALTARGGHVLMYCNDREELDAALKTGIVIQEKQERSAIPANELAISLLFFIIILSIIKTIIRPSK